ncbi:hypothetical protein HG535_0D00330 [Zygotorulaspora mrakii]|uniref:Bud neck involved protein n=1 Tax=Zygotorulaspora mrakii TaxID=42260 RepID=A0A7H9B1N0_ZYGMR|nr:uncharacterized protein HG535_0D00330 [Zygotorulaspora mrakii]QLG72326.1 hypothetical protein HG535_0D00330 [Zygotorulaspora mrakii]
MMSQGKEQGNNRELLNSSFYSSSSINTLDHARNFRNSLILRDMSDHSLETSLKSDNSYPDEKPINGVHVLPQQIARDEETVTMKMSTSPSLSALAGILNEKSRLAQQQAKNSIKTVNVISEETDFYDPNPTASRNDPVMSPNLIDVDGNDSIHFPKIAPPPNALISEQPDFLSSPKMDRNKSQSFKELPKERGGIKNDSRHEPETSIVNDHMSYDKNVKQKIDSGEASHHLSASISSIGPKKKKNIFSFLRRRSSAEIIPKESTNTPDSKSGIPNSSSFSSGTLVSSQTPTRMTKKSYSSNNIFSTFKKGKNNKEESANRTRSHSTTAPLSEKSDVKIINSRTDESIKLHKTRSPSIHKEPKFRKPTPLSFEHIDMSKSSLSQALIPESTPSDENNEDTLLPDDSRLDTGEVLFPKSLSKHEVDSIVSLERCRSTKSNKRSSIASHRRSLTDTLSINAQNEGMFVTEGSSIVISTPDLTKSPTSSILRNGTFEPLEFASNSSVVHDENGLPPTELIDIGDLETYPKVNSFSLHSIEEKLNEMTLDADKELGLSKDVGIQSFKKEMADDPELMSDIMEFASLINFGDGINIEIDDKAIETPYKTVMPSRTSDHSLNETQELDSMHLSQSQFGSEKEDLNLSFGEHFGSGEGFEAHKHNSSPEKYISEDLHTADEYDGFENENFNEIGRSSENTPQIRQLIPDSQMARPLSMSFRGLRAPSLNASLLDSSVIESSLNTGEYVTSSVTDKTLNRVSFSSRIILYDTYAEDEYDRKPDIATCNQLTPQLAQLIKAELNELKCGMEVHEESKCYTHFY